MESDKETLKIFLLDLSDAVGQILKDRTFQRVYEDAERSSWKLFEQALDESLKTFNDSVESHEFIPLEMRKAGFDRKNLELKISFWNSLLDDYDYFNRENTLPRRLYRLYRRASQFIQFGRTELGYILRRLLEFINIILESAGVMGMAHGLDEIKKLAEFTIDTASNGDY